MLIDKFFNFSCFTFNIIKRLSFFCIKFFFIFCFASSSLLAKNENNEKKKEDPTLAMSLTDLEREGTKAFIQKKWGKCGQYFLALQMREPFGKAGEQALLNGGFCLYKNQDFAAAEELFNRFIRLYPDHFALDYAYYLKSLIQFHQNQDFLDLVDRGDNFLTKNIEAIKLNYASFQVFVKRFPNSQYMEDAKTKMTFLAKRLASYQMHVAKTYYKSGAYLSALNRAQQAFKESPDSVIGVEALEMIVKIYDALGEKKLQANTKQILADIQKNIKPI